MKDRIRTPLISFKLNPEEENDSLYSLEQVMQNKYHPRVKKFLNRPRQERFLIRKIKKDKRIIRLFYKYYHKINIKLTKN